MNKKEKDLFIYILKKIKSRSLESLDLKKLKKHENVFRVRKGKIRVIFLMKDKEIKILSLERRSDKTYK